MDEPEDMDDIPKTTKTKDDEECDPLTMNCNEMPKVMENLIRKEHILTEGIGKIDELKQMFPSRPELESLYDDAVQAKEKVHGTISDITTRFSMCTLKEEKPEETEKESETQV